MHYFDEFCEIHLEAGTAPHQWVFRTHEPIQIKFGVALARSPEQGQVAVTRISPDGTRHTERHEAQIEGVTTHGFKLYSLTLAPGINGCTYRYSLGYRDRWGREHTSRQVRKLMICDEAPRSVFEVESTLLDVVNGTPLYGPLPRVKMTPSPQDWNTRLHYSLIIDRFARSETQHREHLGLVEYNPASPFANHGGTLHGLMEKLGYLRSLGVGVIIISPVYVNEPGGYHGYHPVNLFMVDPRFGTLKTLQELVAKAHKLGIAVILDVVVNHIADSIDWEEYGGPPGGEFKYVRGDTKAVLPYPLEARNTNLFHGPEYTDMINQRLFGFLEDWRTETTYVRELLVRHLKYWLAVTDVDGFRYDAVRHVGMDFWQPCVEEIKRYAAYLGKQDFMQIAEHAGHAHEELTEYNPARFNAFFDYPTHYRLKHSLGNGEWLGEFADYFCAFLTPKSHYASGWRNNLMFLDNQDTSRILHEFLSRHMERGMALRCLHFALACAILGPQPPVIYAGTEQEFSGALGYHQRDDTGEWIGHDCHVREDLFDNPECVWKFGKINHKTHPAYSQEHQTFKWIKQLAALRQHFPVISTGHRTVLLSRDHGLRCVLIHDDKGSAPLFIAMNMSINATIETRLPLPTQYGDISGIHNELGSNSGLLEWRNHHLGVRLPAFAFAIGQLQWASDVQQQHTSHAALA